MSTRLRTGVGVGAAQSMWLWALLVGIAGATFATRYRWPLTEDAVMYALDIMRLERTGGSAWPAVFNGELSFGYYGLLLQLYRFWPSPEQLAVVLALVNVFSSVVVIGVLMYLARRWFGCTVAFFAGLLLALAPAFWQLSRYGHPTMPALAAFLGSLALLDGMIGVRRAGWQLASLFVLLAIIAYTFRLDVLLLAPTYLALAAWRGQAVRRQLVDRLTWSSPSGPVTEITGWPEKCVATHCARGSNLFQRVWHVLAYGFNRRRPAPAMATVKPSDPLVWVVVLWVAAVAGYGAIRLLVLGYLWTPGGGSLLLHVGRTLQHGAAAGNVAKNLALWAMGLNPLVWLAAIAAIGGGLWQRRVWPALFLAVWLLPMGVLLPFYALDFSRIATLSAPAAALAAALLPVQFAGRKPALGLAVFLVVAQLAAALIYPVAVRVYMPQTVYQGRPLAAVPLGFVWQDTAYRQRYLDERVRVAQQIAALRDRDVLIVGASNLMLYRWALATMRDAWEEEREAVRDIPIGVIRTAQNRFYLFDADDCPGCERPVAGLVNGLHASSLVVHAVPFDTRFPSQGLLLSDAELANWLREN